MLSLDGDLEQIHLDLRALSLDTDPDQTVSPDRTLSLEISVSKNDSR